MNCGFVKIRSLVGIFSNKKMLRANGFKFLEFCKLGRFCVSLSEFMVNKL